MLYAHLKDVYVKERQPVEPGQLLGTLGNTGLSSHAHLHLEIRISDYDSRIVVDPYDFFAMTVVGFKQEAVYVA